MSMPIVSQVYVKKGSKREDYEDFVIVNEVDNGKVSFSNPFNDTFKLSVEEFNKKYVKGNSSDYDMFEEGQDIELVEVNGKEYPIVSQVYVKKGSKREDYEDFVIVNEVDNGKVSFSNPFNDWFELSVDEFNKKYVKGNKRDYYMFEEGQDIQLVEVNGKEYPVLSQGKDAYICLDEEGNKFKVTKGNLDEGRKKPVYDYQVAGSNLIEGIKDILEPYNIIVDSSKLVGKNMVELDATLRGDKDFKFKIKNYFGPNGILDSVFQAEKLNGEVIYYCQGGIGYEKFLKQFIKELKKEAKKG